MEFSLRRFNGTGLLGTGAVLGFAVAAWLAPGFARAADIHGSSVDQHALFKVVGEMYNLDPELLEAVAQVESAGRPDAVSHKGAVGLMQLMPDTSTRFHVKDPRDPIENALGAARYLAYLKELSLARGDNDGLSLILAAYNAGEGAVWRYNGLPPFPETQAYVGRVLWVYLLGIRSALPAHQAARRSALSKNRSGDAAVLDELDSLRRARAAAQTSDQ